MSDQRIGKRCRLMEKLPGWTYNGLLGKVVAFSARDEFLLLEIEEDPEGYWPVGSRVLCELGTSHGRTTTAVMEP